MTGQPIRWDNIVAPQMGAPASTLESAARMLNGAFSAFQAPLVQAEATQARNWDTGKVNNTLDARAALMQFADAKRFKDALDGGQVANIINQYGAQADRGALMDFADSRLPTLQQRDVQGIQYKNTMLDDAQAKSRDRILGMINSGNQTLIDRAMQELPGMDLRVKADIYQRGNEAQRRQIDLAHADESHIWEKQKMDAQIQRWKDETAIGRANVDVNRQQVENQRLGMQQQFASHIDEGMLKLFQSKSKLTPVTATSEEGGKMVADALAGLKDGSAQRNIGKAVTAFIEANPNVPATVVASAIRTGDQRWWMPDFSIRNEVTANLASLAKAAEQDNSSKGKQEARAYLDEQAQRLTATRDTVQRQLYTSLFPKASGAMPGSSDPKGGTIPSPFDMPTPDQSTKPVSRPAEPPASQAPVQYQPGTAAPAPAGLPPVVQQAQSTLARLASKPVQNLSVTDRLEMRNAQLVLQRAQEEAAAAARAVQAPSAPQYDPAMISRLVEQASAGAILPPGFRR